jgi:hypothetical protein
MYKLEMRDIVGYKGELGVIARFEGDYVGILPQKKLVPRDSVLLVKKHNHKIRFYGKWYSVVRCHDDGTLVLRGNVGIRRINLANPNFERGWKIRHKQS